MIDSLQIKNFRCFRELSVNDFGVINVVVGDNGSGKTALLESIFLCQMGTPEAAMRTRVWPGLGSTFISPTTRDSYNALWKDLFFQFHQDRPIEISNKGTKENTWSVKIFYDPKDPSSIPVSKTDKSVGVINIAESDLAAITPITFEHTNNGRKLILKPTFHILQGLVQAGGTPHSVPAAFYSSSFATVVLPSEIASQFSELDKKNKSKPILKAIKKLYPQIVSLGVQTELGVLLLFCEVRGLAEKVPIAIESAGTHKLTAYLLGIASQANGVVLIDEIENGFYYKKMPDVWWSLFSFCKQFKVQLFASTHSEECLRAILPTLRGNEAMFRLIRTERKDNNRVVKTFKGKDFEAAMQENSEVR